jgi:diguanylate cyclase (GGDEF)-like protein
MINDAMIQRMRRAPLWAALLTVSLVTLLLGYTDLLLGTEISFSIFYLIPVTLAVFFSGRTLGLVFSFICALVWIFADVFAGLAYSSMYIPIWNTLVRLLYFIVHTFIISKLIDSVDEIREVSLHDPLTGAVNWRYFEEFANRLIKAADRDGTTITLAYIDVDNFKLVNDTWGHDAGDEVLTGLVKAVGEIVRPTDILARLGGDEFVVLFAGVGLDGAREIISRVHECASEVEVLKRRGVTLSIGAEVFSRMSDDVSPMLKDVDGLMYEIKKGGKNDYRVVEQAT